MEGPVNYFGFHQNREEGFGWRRFIWETISGRIGGRIRQEGSKCGKAHQEEEKIMVKINIFLFLCTEEPRGMRVLSASGIVQDNMQNWPQNPPDWVGS